MNKKKKRKNMSKFKRFFLIYSGILAAAMIMYLSKIMSRAGRHKQWIK